MIPQVMLVIPLFLLVNRLGWIDTYQGLILPMAFSLFRCVPAPPVLPYHSQGA